MLQDTYYSERAQQSRRLHRSFCKVQNRPQPKLSMPQAGQNRVSRSGMTFCPLRRRGAMILELRIARGWIRRHEEQEGCRTFLSASSLHGGLFEVPHLDDHNIIYRADFRVHHANTRIFRVWLASFQPPAQGYRRLQWASSNSQPRCRLYQYFVFFK